jgi:hypothetical protein
VGKLEKQKTFRFSRYRHEARAFHKKSLVVTKEQRQRLFEIYVTYDLNMACLKTGPIYTTFYNIYSNMQQELTRKFPLEKLTKAEIIHLLVLLICDLENLDCPPLHYVKVTYQNKSQFENVHSNQKRWLGKLLSHSTDLVQKIEKFCRPNREVTDVIEFVSTISRELTDMDNYGVQLMTMYEDAFHANDFPKHLISEKDTIFKDIETICSTASEYLLKLKQYQDSILE